MIRTDLTAKLRTLYLSFDDGPHPTCTAKVLRVLEQCQAPATFFVVAERAQQYAGLVRTAHERGHAIGNHSLNHRWAVYFRGRKKMLEWIRQAEAQISAITGAPTIGFRPPAGICTPELRWALRQAQMPLWLWNHRFYDTVFAWKTQKALRSLKKMKNNDIILLHDTHTGMRERQFLFTLAAFIDRARSEGFQFATLPPFVAASKSLPEVKESTDLPGSPLSF